MRPFSAFVSLLFCTITLTLCGPSIAVADTYKLILKCGKKPRSLALVHFPIPKNLQKIKTFSIREAGTENYLPMQRTAAKLIWKLNRPIKTDETRAYLLSTSNNSDLTSNKQDVVVKNDGHKLTVFSQQKPVLVYNMATLPSHDPQKPFYARSGHIHPLYNPRGQIVSDDFAPDHPHQHGLFFAWTHTNWQDKKIDFWNQHRKQGTVAHAKLEETSSGPVFGHFKSGLNHIELTEIKNPNVALRETWEVRIYHFKNLFLIDLISSQLAKHSPLKIRKYHYGGFAIRGQRNWDVKQGGKFLTSDQKTRIDGNHTRPRWVSLYGPIEGENSTVTIFDHPDNFRFPQPVRLHPRMPYFCFAPLVLGDFDIGTVNPYISRYRLAVTMGEPDPTLLEQLWEDYARPLQAKIMPRK